MMLMIIAALIVFGLCLGSFVNALVWRLHSQAAEQGKAKPNKKYLRDLSITKGHSMCLSCKHPLAKRDLIPVLSWLLLRGKCRYCHKPIPDTPVAELLTPLLFVVSYLYWPVPFTHPQIGVFVQWLLLLVGFVALTLYDLRWYLLPDRIVYPLGVLAFVVAIINVVDSHTVLHSITNLVLAVAVGGGIFYVLFQVSGGRWIGGGDVKLGWLLGLVVGTPAKAALFIFAAALGGTIVSVPLLVSGKMKRNTTIPFGPFLIAGAIISVLFGTSILSWYQHLFLLGV